jgi:hypothetical protein
MRTLVYVFAAFAEVPRANCDTHGIHQVALPWAEAGGRFTALFETLVIDWLHEASADVCTGSTTGRGAAMGGDGHVASVHQVDDKALAGCARTRCLR